MKILCVSCDRLSDLQSYRLDAGVLVVTCGRCGAEMRAVDAPAKAVQDSREPAPPPPPSSSSKVVALRPVGEDPAKLAAKDAESQDPFAAPEDRCPKCIAPRSKDALVCPQCGLTFVNFMPSEVRPPEPLEPKWRDLLRNWSNEKAHDAFLAEAVAHSALPQIARLYQIRIALNADDLAALRARDEVLRLATASATATALSKSAAPDRRAFKLVALAVGALAFVFAFVFLLRQLLNVSH